MNQSSSWTGADSTLTGTINAKQSFVALYTTGDATIAVGGPDAEDWPYRVTITSTGYAVDPGSSATTTTYKVEAVAKLVPRELQKTLPVGDHANYVVYQTNTDDVNLRLPFRIEGRACFQGSLCRSAKPIPRRRLPEIAPQRPERYAPTAIPTYVPSLSYYVADILDVVVDRSLFTSNSASRHQRSGFVGGWAFPECQLINLSGGRRTLCRLRRLPPRRTSPIRD
jgi:hypothetical protein